MGGGPGREECRRERDGIGRTLRTHRATTRYGHIRRRGEGNSRRPPLCLEGGDNNVCILFISNILFPVQRVYQSLWFLMIVASEFGPPRSRAHPTTKTSRCPPCMTRSDVHVTAVPPTNIFSSSSSRSAGLCRLGGVRDRRRGDWYQVLEGVGVAGLCERSRSGNTPPIGSYFKISVQEFAQRKMKGQCFIRGDNEPKEREPQCELFVPKRVGATPRVRIVPRQLYLKGGNL